MAKLPVQKEGAGRVGGRAKLELGLAIRYSRGSREEGFWKVGEGIVDD